MPIAVRAVGPGTAGGRGHRCAGRFSPSAHRVCSFCNLGIDEGVDEEENRAPSLDATAKVMNRFGV
jgi:hypothetical protein